MLYKSNRLRGNKMKRYHIFTERLSNREGVGEGGREGESRKWEISLLSIELSIFF